MRRTDQSFSIEYCSD